MTTSIGTIANENNESLGRLLFGLIDRPAVTFKKVVARRKWWMWAVPLLIVFAALAVMTVVSAPYMAELGRQQAELRLASMPAEQAEAARSVMQTSLSLPVLIATSLISGIVMLLLGVLAQATFLYFGALVSGGEVQFGPVFTMSVWTRLPFALHFLTMAGFMAMSWQAIEYQGLAFLVSSGNMLQDARQPLYILLSQINIFWLWHLFLIVIGLAVVARFSRGKSLLLALLYVALALGLSVLPALLFGGMMAG